MGLFLNYLCLYLYNDAVMQIKQFITYYLDIAMQKVRNGCVLLHCRNSVGSGLVVSLFAILSNNRLLQSVCYCYDRSSIAVGQFHWAATSMPGNLAYLFSFSRARLASWWGCHILVA